LLGRTRRISESENKKWFLGLRKRKDCIYFAIETSHGERYIGHVWLWGVDRSNRKAELRIFIGEDDCMEKGIGTEAIRLACCYGFNTMRLHKIYAYVHAANSRARCAFEKAGFQVEGLLKGDRRIGRRFIDVCVLGKLQDAH
jgi:RimJ/RimL family protein N-acetyltransferase